MNTATLRLPAVSFGFRETGVSTATPQVVEKSSETVGWTGKIATSVSSVAQSFSVELPDILAWSFRLTAEGLNETLRSIETLNDEVDDEVGPATDFAVALALTTIKRAGALLSKDVPVGSACPDVNGGIRVTWNNKEREVRLIIPGTANGRGYLYLSTNGISDISDNFWFDALAVRLKWLMA